MESEKVKEIKELLLRKAKEYESQTLLDILTLINDLESEKNSVLSRNKELFEKNESLKDRIAELEKEIEENAFYSKGYADGIKNTYEVVIPDKLKQFAERLIEKMGVREYMGVKYKQGVFSENDIDEILKEVINE